MALLPTRFLQSGAYSAQELRAGVYNPNELGEGLIGGAGGLNPDQGLRVYQGGGMSVNVKAGAALIRGDDAGNQGLYFQENDGLVNVAVPAAHASLPRLDALVLRIQDASVSGGSNFALFQVVSGTPTSGATLVNRNGAAAIPNSAIHLADILIPAAAASVTDGNIVRRAARVSRASTLNQGGNSSGEGAMFEPVSGGYIENNTTALVTNTIASTAVFLPKPVKGATLLGFHLQNGGAAPSSTPRVNVGIYDTGFRKITETGIVNLTGSAGQLVGYYPSIPAIDLDAGMYVVAIGVQGANLPSLGRTIVGAPDMGFNKPNAGSSGGVTLPAAFTSFAGPSGDGSCHRVPFLAVT